MTAISCSNVCAVAATLHAELKDCRVAQSLADLGPELTVELAYELQHQLTMLREAEGDSVIGYKIGCTSPTIRAALGVKDSIFGRLWDSEQRPNGAQLSDGDFRGLAIEGEIGLKLISMEGPPSSWIVEYMPVIELHHGQLDCATDVRAAELIAKNAIHAGVVRADQAVRCALADVPLDTPIVVTVDDQVREQPVLRNLQLGGKLGPLGTISWLVQRLSKGNHQLLEPGSFVLAATPGSLIPVEAGATVKVRFGELETQCSVHPSVARSKM